LGAHTGPRLQSKFARCQQLTCHPTWRVTGLIDERMPTLQRRRMAAPENHAPV
jgi:hypothetical protein